MYPCHTICSKVLRVFLLLLLLPTIIFYSSDLYAQKTAVWDVIDTLSMDYFGNWEYHNVLGVADENHYAIIGKEQGQSYKRHVRRTSDGGATWTTILFDTARGATIGEQWEEHWTDIAHPEPDIIVVTGYRSALLPNATNANEAIHTGFYHVTNDGGATWNRYDLDSNNRPGALSMCDASHGFMAIQLFGNRDNLKPNTRPDYILRTTDGWKTSTAFNLPSGITFCKKVICIEPNIYILLAFNKEHGEPRVYRTTDGGVNWRESASLPEGMGIYITSHSLTFINSLTGWSAWGNPTGIGNDFSDVIAKTTDGGMTWQIQLDQSIPPLHGLISIGFADELNGLAVGRGVKMLRTRDGGQNWVQEFPPYYIQGIPSILNIAYPREDLAIAVYSSSPIIKYSGRETLLPPMFTSLTIEEELLPVDNQVLEWTPISGATEYRVQVAPMPPNIFKFDTTHYHTSIVDTVMADTRLLLNALQYNRCYYARVRSLNDQEKSDWSKENYDRCSFFTVESENTVFPPDILQPANGEIDVPVTVTVVWESVADALTYDVQVSEDRNFADPELMVLNRSEIQDTMWTFGDLKLDTEYHIRTRVHTAENASEWSDDFVFHSFRTAKVTDVADEVVEVQSMRINVTPHPVAQQARIFVSGLSRAGDAELTLYDIMGAKVANRKYRILPETEMTLELSDVPNGIYFLRFISGDDALTKKVCVIR